MSQVTNILLVLSALEPLSRIEQVNPFFTGAGYERGLVSIEDESLPPGWYGGNKPFEAEVFVGAFNFLDLDGLVTFMQAIAWEDRDNVQLIVQEQADKKFRIITL